MKLQVGDDIRESESAILPGDVISWGAFQNAERAPVRIILSNRLEVRLEPGQAVFVGEVARAPLARHLDFSAVSGDARPVVATHEWNCVCKCTGQGVVKVNFACPGACPPGACIIYNGQPCEIPNPPPTPPGTGNLSECEEVLVAT